MIHIAHRGASGFEPENTLLAFEKAMKMGVDMLELDVRVSKEGIAVVIHDKKVDKITNGRGKVNKLSLSELKALDAGNGQTIPTLQEVLDFVHGRVKLNIDMKDDKAVSPTLTLIEKYVTENIFSYGDFLLSAFKPSILKKINKTNRKIHTAFNFVAFPLFFLFLSKWMKLSYIKPQKRLISEKFVKAAHKNHLKVLVWTINTPEDLEKMKLLHVDGIITDYPDLI